jgi:hypothetical protein
MALKGWTIASSRWQRHFASISWRAACVSGHFVAIGAEICRVRHALVNLFRDQSLTRWYYSSNFVPLPSSARPKQKHFGDRSV